MALARNLLGDLEKLGTKGPKNRPTLDIRNSINIQVETKNNILLERS